MMHSAVILLFIGSVILAFCDNGGKFWWTKISGKDPFSVVLTTAVK
jgi:hypothetical protein